MALDGSDLFAIAQGSSEWLPSTMDGSHSICQRLLFLISGCEPPPHTVACS